MKGVMRRTGRRRGGPGRTWESDSRGPGRMTGRRSGKMRAAFSSQQALDCSRVAPGAARVPETNANPQHETAHRPEADATPCRGGRNWSQIATIPGSPRPIADSAC